MDKSKTPKLEILVNRQSISLIDMFDNKTLGEAIQYLNDIASKYAPKHGDIVKFEVKHYGYDGGLSVHMKFFREETDEEYKKRMDQLAIQTEKNKLIEKKKRELKKKMELELLAKLKKKYDNTNYYSSNIRKKS